MKRRLRVSWGRRVSDRVRPILVGVITSILASAGTAGASYVANQIEIQQLDEYWRSYWRACGIKRE